MECDYNICSALGLWWPVPACLWHGVREALKGCVFSL